MSLLVYENKDAQVQSKVAVDCHMSMFFLFRFFAWPRVRTWFDV